MTDGDRKGRMSGSPFREFDGRLVHATYFPLGTFTRNMTECGLQCVGTTRHPVSREYGNVAGEYVGYSEPITCMECLAQQR